MVSRTREGSCPRVNEFSAKSYFVYEAAMARAISGAAGLYSDLRLIRKRGALLLPPKNCLCELKETTTESLAKLFPNWMYCKTGPGNVAGSIARTPTDVLLPLGPRAFGLNGRRLGPRGVASETCARLVRLLVKLTGRDWFAIKIMSAPSAS